MRKTFAVLALAMTLVVGCGRQSGKSRGVVAGRLIKVVCTTGMITDIVKNVGGHRVDATGLMGPGIDPHLYKARESDVTLMAEADIIFYNGLHLEGAMTKVFEKMRRRIQTTAVAESIPDSRLLSPQEFQGAHDPHVWFDVALWMKSVESVRNALVELDPGSAAGYRERTDHYLKELADLHGYVQSRAQRVPRGQRVLITAHDAFNYFGRAYGFEVRGLQGISTATESGTADVKELADFIAERKIRAIFVESSVPRRNIEAVRAAVRARGFDVKIGGELYSDALGNPGTPEGSYIGMVRHNIDTIVAALLGE